MQNSIRDANQTPQLGKVARILVVDDEPSILEYLRNIFLQPRYKTAVAPNGIVAQELAAREGFDLAFVDFYFADMNGVVSMNGIEISRKLHELQPNLKIVLMSGFLNEERTAMVQEAGACAFLMKPFFIEAVQTLADRLLNNKK